MYAAVLMMLLAAGGEVHVAAVGFKAVSVDENKAAFLTDYFSDQLGKAGHFSVTTPAQVAAMIGQERQKQLLGCSEESGSCLAEIAGAIGSDALITGTVARIGVQWAVEVKITRTSDGKAIASAAQTLSREEEVLPWLHDRADEMGIGVRKALGGKVETVTVHPLRGKAVIPFIVGGLLVGAAGYTHSQAQDIHDQLISPNSTYTTRATEQSAIQQGQLYNDLTVGAAILGGLAIATGLSFVLWSEEQDVVAASFTVTPSGGAFALGGSF